MLANIAVLYTIVTIYLIKDLFSQNRLANQASTVVSFTSLLWWLVNYSDLFNPYMLETSICVGVGALYFIFLLCYESLTDIRLPIRRGLLYGGFFWWLFCLYQVVHVFLNHTFLLSPLMLKLLVFGPLFFLMGIFYKYLPLTMLNKFLGKIRLEQGFLLAYFFIHIYLFFIADDYMSSPKFYYFYIMYLSFYMPYFFSSPLRTVRLFFHAVIFSVLFLVLGGVYYGLFSMILFPNLSVPFQWLYYFISPIFIVLFFKGFDRISNQCDQFFPFSVINQAQFFRLVDGLKSISKLLDVQQCFLSFSMFKSLKHSAHLWVVQDRKYCNAITQGAPILDSEVLLFLQYKESVHISELDKLLLQYSQTPFQSNVRLVSNFMMAYSIVKISLLQKSREMVGVFAVSFKDSRLELLDFDLQKFQLLEDVLSNTLCNSNSVSRLLTHQNILERINVASSKFNISIDEEAYYTIIRKTLINIIPEIKFYFLLKYDSDSQFYKRSFLLTKKHLHHTMKIHSKVLDHGLKDNMYIKYTINQANVPVELQTAMQSIGAIQALLIRLNESKGSSIFVLFFDSNIDVLDYRISFCQMFLRQSEIFYQYQANCEELTALQLFLKRVLDQLPTGILISSLNYELKYINSKMNQQLGGDIVNNSNDDIRQIGISQELIEGIDYVKSMDTEYVKKVELPLNQRHELYLLSSFKIYQDQEPSIIVVLTNIQQSKELIDQMNQTNRLAMMSKIAKGISYELKQPVHQLIEGVKQIQDRWKDTVFQDNFLTDIVPQVDRINLLCQSLLRLSRSNTESLVEVFLPDLLDQVLRLISGDLRYTTQKFYVGTLDREWIIVDQVMAIQVLMNLMIFCLKSLTMESSRLSLDIMIADEQFLSIKIAIKEYNGQGFTNEDDLKDQLELSIVNQIVMNQNGQFDIFCESQLASFHILLPIKKVKVATTR